MTRIYADFAEIRLPTLIRISPPLQPGPKLKSSTRSFFNTWSSCVYRKTTLKLFAPWAPITKDCSISAVLDGPAINRPNPEC